MSCSFVITGATIFDGVMTFENHGLLVEDGLVAGIEDEADIPSEWRNVPVSGGLLAPGFVDLQVNGGGGVLFNDQPTLAAIEKICNAHLQFGTTGLLPTLITDTPEVTSRAIEAGIEAKSKKVPGFVGLHLEGPHLAPARKGAHAPALIREMTDDDCSQLIVAGEQLPHLMVTLAPESVSNSQIARLSAAGIIVSLGHSGATFTQAKQAYKAGARCITHLYNAMSPLGHREPGLVGAALSAIGFHCGLIADGYHVDPQVISISLAAKNDSGRIFLVSDAMSTIGTDMKCFELNGRTIYRDNGRLTLEDGTLAGADLELGSAVKYLVTEVGIDREEALRMASVYPMDCLGQSRSGLSVGSPANIVHLDDELNVCRVWQGGEPAAQN